MNGLRWISLCVVCMFASLALAQPTPGVVTGTNVYVRSGAGTTAYPCAKVSAPEQVHILGEVAGWYRIMPPAGCFSVISKQFVRSDDGKTGVVTGDNVWVRAAGELTVRDRVSDYGLAQLQLSSGAQVQIVGEFGDYYRITPPEGAFFYISTQYVKPTAPIASSTRSEAVTVAPGDVTAPPSDMGSEAAEAMESATQPATAVRSADMSKDRLAVEQLRQLERELVDEMNKPVAARDLDSLLARYKAIEISGSDTALNKALQGRIAFLQDNIGRKQQLRQVDQLVSDVARRQADVDSNRAKIAVADPEMKPLTFYTAEGVLTPSSLFPGMGAVPKRWAVVDPNTNRTMAYVQCTTGAVSLADHENQYVGIHGSTSFSDRLKLNVVEAKEIVVLSPKASLPEPPKPVVVPMTPAAAVTPATAASIPLALPAAPQPRGTVEPASEAPTAEPSTQPAGPATVEELPPLPANTNAAQPAVDAANYQ